jgi:hypothetical protein
MMQLAEKYGDEACVAKTPSFEYWDEMPSRSKIDSMAQYLHDVSNGATGISFLFAGTLKLTFTVSDTSRDRDSQRVSIWGIVYHHHR